MKKLFKIQNQQIEVKDWLQEKYRKHGMLGFFNEYLAWGRLYNGIIQNESYYMDLDLFIFNFIYTCGINSLIIEQLCFNDKFQFKNIAHFLSSNIKIRNY